MEIKRKKFEGVKNILSFNRHFYYLGLGVLFSIFLFWKLIDLPMYFFYVIFFFFAYGLLIPLFVSAYIYDYSGYYDFKWLDMLGLTKKNNLNIVNINAGFDETSFIIKRKFPEAYLKVYDFYNQQNHTEKAIIRARKVSQTYPNTIEIKTNHIPLKDNSVDVIFLLSSVHEIRNEVERNQFFNECGRVCKSNGKIIVVEHLRDLPNFLAFSIGFTHFFSKNVWKKTFEKADIKLIKELKFTSFMSIFNLKPMEK